jgi:hypothetical protein
MKRAENCVDCKITHITFEGDSLVFQFAKSKSQQDGEEHIGPWHIYANPKEPFICPVLSLARYLFTFPNVLVGKSPLFEGTAQYNRYSNFFSRILRENHNQLPGVNTGDLGTHSCRKGVATMVAAGCTCSPPIVSICVRAGWSMGGVKDRYLKHEKAGDQYVGRCATCSDQNSKEFAISPPYFDFTSLSSESEKIRTKNLIKQWLQERLVNVDNIAPITFNLAMQCFASICYHYDFLSDKLHPKSSFHSCSMFKDIPLEIKKVVRVAYPWDRTEDTPRFTGIPPHVTLLAQMEEMKKHIDELEKKVVSHFERALDARGIGGSEFHTNQILQAIRDLGNQMDTSQQHVRQEMATASTPYTFDEEDDNIDFDIDGSAMSSHDDETAQEEIALQRSKVNDKVSTAIKRRHYKVGLVGSCLTTLPPGFQFPKSLTCEQLVTNWFIGNGEKNIIPYCRLRPSELRQVKNGGITHRKMRRFMAAIERYGRIEGKWVEQFNKWTPQSVSLLWNCISQKYIFRRYSKTRTGTISWKSIYNNMLNAKVFKKAQECSNEEWKHSVYNVNYSRAQFDAVDEEQHHHHEERSTRTTTSASTTTPPRLDLLLALGQCQDMDTGD